MKWTLQQLNGLKNKGLEFDETIDLSELTKIDTQIREVSPVRVIGKADFSKNTISFSLEVTGELILPCSRTLADVELPFDLHLTEIFALENSWQSEYGDEEEEIHLVEGDTIDLKPYIMENILLEIPLQIISENADEKGLHSGQDWELITEEMKKDRIDPRLADLAKFFDKD